MDRRPLYESLIREHSGDLYRLAYRLCGQREAAQDLVQETFTEAWRFIHTLRDEERARAWLVRILRNRWWHWQRTASRRPVTEALPEALAAAPGPREADALQSALDRLDPLFREPFLLAFLEGFRGREIAAILGVPHGTVLSRIHRARQHLKVLLAEDADNGRVRPLRREVSS